MIILTKEWLMKTIAELEEERDATPGAVNEDAAMALEAMKIAQASLEAKPIGAFHIADQQVDGTSDYIKDGEWPIDDGVIEVYAAPPAPMAVPEECPAEIRELMSSHSDDLFNDEDAQEIWNACRAAMLQGAEHAESPTGINQGKSEPVKTANKLRDAVEIIRNSGIEIDAEKIFAERDVLNTPDCWCRTCRPVTVTDMRFVVCPDCGNKRCPHANDHRNACTGSNEPGQEGSAYPAAPQQEVK